MGDSASPEPTTSYPGDAVSAAQLLDLAQEYRKAAILLKPYGTPGKAASRAPWRLLAVHAIELYLNAFLLHVGGEPGRIRGLQHDLSARAQQAVAKGLTLRKLTARHLASMTGGREYVVVRYSPDLLSSMSQINRLDATLDELAEKITAKMKLV